MSRLSLIGALVVAGLVPGTGLAKEADAAQSAALVVRVPADSVAAESVAVEIASAGQLLWSGRLRLGGGYGNASFSQSINEYGDMCPSAASTSAMNRQSNQSLNFNMSRANWQQEPDRFAINVQVTRPLPPCEGEGSNMSGFNRTVTLLPGQPLVVVGEGGLTVRLTRARR